jgi:hypothetical protein
LKDFSTIEGCLYGFSSEGKILDLIYGAGKRELLKSYLLQNGGVKIFRDGIRVYNYELTDELPNALHLYFP